MDRRADNTPPPPPPSFPGRRGRPRSEEEEEEEEEAAACASDSNSLDESERGTAWWRYWGATRHGNALVGTTSPLDNTTAPRPRRRALAEEVEAGHGDDDDDDVDDDDGGTVEWAAAACCRILTTSRGANAVTYIIDPTEPEKILEAVDDGGGSSFMVLVATLL